MQRLYDFLTDLMRVVSGGTMLNFGYWELGQRNPLEAQYRMCEVIADLVRLGDGQCVLDVGSGLGAPAVFWQSKFNLDKVSCINICESQIRDCMILNHLDRSIVLQVASSLQLPVASKSMDRVIALESAQHFRPIENFFHEALRVLKPGGILGLAIPGIHNSTSFWRKITRLGLLNLTWFSECYDLSSIPFMLQSVGFRNIEQFLIGAKVFIPLANYYLTHRKEIRSRVLTLYPSFVEQILYSSILKMKATAQQNFIEYALIRAQV